VDVVASTDDVLYLTYGRSYGRAREPFLQSGWAQLHGGVMRIDGRRVLVVGDKGAGKTALALRLLFDGHGFEGDETVLTRDGVAMPVARNLHVKPGSQTLIPELTAGWDELPSTGTDDGELIRALNPVRAGISWEIQRAMVDLAVVLVAAHGGATTARPLSGIELVQHVLPHAAAASSSRTDLLRALTALLGHVPGLLVRVGDLPGAVAALSTLEA
jgi:hypothetical protein